MNKVIGSQWDDLCLRRHDPYGMTKYAILLDWLGDVSGKSILVVGCGGGDLCAMFAAQGAFVHATDIDPQYVELTRKTAQDFGVKFTTEVTSLDDMIPRQKFDYVVATDVIEHIQDDHRAVQKIFEMTASGGKAVITVPASPLLFGYHDRILGHFRRYTGSSLKNVMEPWFRTQKIRHFGFWLIPVTLIYSKWLQIPYPVTVEKNAKSPGSFLTMVLKLLCTFEKRVSFGTGTSLLYIGEKNPLATIRPTPQRPRNLGHALAPMI